MLGPRQPKKTHQAFRPGVDDTNKQEADWEPILGILDVEISKGYDPHFLDDCNASAANGRLDAQ